MPQSGHATDHNKIAVWYLMTLVVTRIPNGLNLGALHPANRHPLPSVYRTVSSRATSRSRGNLT